jgi:hypothetical protein
MANYVLYEGRWRGHSTNDTIPPQALTFLSRRQDTDTGIIYYYDGHDWLRSGTHDVGSNYIQMSEIAVPTTPTADKCRLFIDSATGLLSQVDSAGVVTPIGGGEGGGGGGTVTPSSTDTFTNKTFNADGTGNSITNIENADIKAAAGIVYSKLSLTGGILNADINASAAIAKSKLASLDVVNADVNASAAIVTSKLADSANFLLKTLDNAFGAHYHDITKMTAPTNPSANDIRLYVDTSDTHLKLRNNAGTIVDLHSAGVIADAAVTTAKLATSLTGINAKIPDGEFTWAKIDKTGATAVIKETIAYGFQGTAVRVSSMIMGTNHSTNGQGTSGHVWGVPMVVKRVRIIPVSNAKTGNTVIKLWKDSTELASWTISAGSTTETDSGAISHAITATEKMDFTCDTSAGGSSLSISIGFLVDIEKTINLT